MDNRILDDLAKVAAGALGGVSGVRQEIEARLRQQFERVLANMEVVSREEFEVVRAMAAKARAEQEVLATRLTAVEERLGSPTVSGV
jgi:BMFP domain-containing protein YqiC